MSASVLLFGGSFDPIHTAHLILAEHAAGALGVGEVLFVPCGRPPHKRREDLTAAPLRAEMVRLAIEGNDRFALSTIELERKGRSYAIDTIRQVRAARRGARPAYLIGSDSLADLPAWREPEAIAAEAELVVVRRGAERAAAPELGGGYLLLDAPRIDLSATEIRRRVRRGESIRYLVPERVRAFIEAHGLYRREGDGDADGP